MWKLKIAVEATEKIVSRKKTIFAKERKTAAVGILDSKEMKIACDQSQWNDSHFSYS